MAKNRNKLFQDLAFGKQSTLKLSEKEEKQA